MSKLEWAEPFIMQVITFTSGKHHPSSSVSLYCSALLFICLCLGPYMQQQHTASPDLALWLPGRIYIKPYNKYSFQRFTTFSADVSTLLTSCFFLFLRALWPRVLFIPQAVQLPNDWWFWGELQMFFLLQLKSYVFTLMNHHWCSIAQLLTDADYDSTLETWWREHLATNKLKHSQRFFSHLDQRKCKTVYSQHMKPTTEDHHEILMPVHMSIFFLLGLSQKQRMEELKKERKDCAHCCFCNHHILKCVNGIIFNLLFKACLTSA